MGDDTGFQTVYNTLSFSLASMMATTMYLWFRSFAVKDKYQSAVLISGLVTFIAAYHYIRIFNSWVESYEYQAGTPDKYGALFIEALLVMKLPDGVFSAKAKTLGLGSALMIISGYYGELVVTGDLTPRWICWACSMCFFLYVVYELLVGLAAATAQEQDPVIKGKIQQAQVWTVVSWCTYPVVYLFPMVGLGGCRSVVNIQVGYCISDIISKCGVG